MGDLICDNYLGRLKTWAGRSRALRKEIGLTQQSVLFGGLFVVTPASLFLPVKVSKSHFRLTVVKELTGHVNRGNKNTFGLSVILELKAENWALF